MAAADERMGFGAVLDRLRGAVRAVVATDPDPTDPYRGLYVDDQLALRLGDEQPAAVLEERFAVACARLGLTDLERAVLAMCVAPEAHPDVGRLFGFLHDDLTRRSASPRLVARLLAGSGGRDEEVLGCFDERAQLRQTGAIRLGSSGPLADRDVTVGAQLAAFLLGSNIGDVSCDGRLRRVERSLLPTGRENTIARIRGLLAHAGALPLALAGPDALELLMAASASGAAVLDAAAALEPAARDDLALAAALDGRVAVIDGIGGIPREDRDLALRRILALCCRPVIHVPQREDQLALAEQAVLMQRVPALSAVESTAAWRAATGSDDLRGVSDRFQLDLGRIAEAATIARAEAAVRGASELDAELLAFGARTASSRRVTELANLLRPGPGWDDLVLPPRQLAGLHSLSSYLRHREKVLGDWGYGRIASGQGLTALFAGESGTGKTLSARVVAGAAGLDVYRVDLAGLFSKWVGETEKNLDRIFRAAENSNAVLFFDEADVVFSQRSAVSDASDRYANLETAYLLQRIEEYEGIVILATNLRSNIDDAFLRRIDIAIDFPPPDVATRQLLWSALIPRQAPLDDRIDLDFLAKRFELTGGGIRNCAVSAAFLAADEGTPIGMPHLVRAVALEYTKLGRLTLKADFEQFHDLVRGPGAAPG